MKLKNKKAFTFIEMMVVVLISTVAMAGIYGTLNVGNRAWKYYNNAVAIKREVRRALFSIVTELREAQNVRVIQGKDESAVHFYKPSTGYVSYVWNLNGEDANKIIRRNRLDTRMLAKYISALSFQHAGNTIVVSISAEKETEDLEMVKIDLKEKITLRSKTKIFTR